MLAKMHIRAIVLLLACVSVQCAMVHTASGAVKGTLDPRHSVTAFRSIPFAENPDGELKFAPPEPRKPWQHVHDGTRYGAGCFHSIEFRFAAPREQVSTDCLSLSVFVPGTVSTPPNEKDLKPVIAYIHGGGFITGSSTHDLISPDPSQFVNKTDVVFVQMQYRLGPLGFLALPELTEKYGTSGLLGLLDQQLAMKWIQKNIALFGGDPSRVTLMGESAGAFSICFHMTQPDNQGLFQSVILQSAMCDMEFQTLEEGHDQGDKLAAAVGCNESGTDRIACLRNVPAPVLQTALPGRRGLLLHEGVRWFPIIDRRYAPQHPIISIQEGKVLNVSVLVGNNADEGSLFILLAYKFAVLPEAWYDMLQATFTTEQVKRLDEGFPSRWSTHRRMCTLFDNMFSCSIRRLARYLSKRDIPVYVYHYGLIPQTLQWPYANIGAFHGSELLYQFRDDEALHSKELYVSKMLRHFWAAFAHNSSSKPGAAMSGEEIGATDWLSYDLDRPAYYLIDDVDSKKSHLQREKIAPLDQLPVSAPLFKPGALEEDHPHQLCALFDELTDEQNIVHPAKEYPDRWLSAFLNIQLLQTIEFVVVYARFLLAILVLLVIAAYKRRSRPQPKKEE